VNPSETPLDIQERIGSVMNTLCFPDQKILMNGKTLPSNQSVSKSGLKDGDVLELVFDASEQTLVGQLSDLLGTKAMSLEELSLMYVHRHLVTVHDALVALGHAKGDFKAFVNGEKCFSFDGQLLKVADTQKSQQAQTTSQVQKKSKKQVTIKECGPIEVKVSVEIHVPGRAPVSPSYNDDDDEDMDLLRLEASDTVARAKHIIAASQQIPFPDTELLLGENKMEDGLSLSEAGAKSGVLLVLVVHASIAVLASQLEGFLLERVALSVNELSLHYCQRYGTPVCQALRSLGLPANLKRFLEEQPQFCFTGGCVTLANGLKLVKPSLQEEEEEDESDDCMWHDCQ